MSIITAYEEVLKSRDTAKIITFLKKHPIVLDQMNEQGTTGFLLLAYHQLPSVLEAVVPLKKKWNLFEATAYGAVDKVAAMLKIRPALANIYTPDGFPLLTLACYFGQLKMAKLLVAKKVNIDRIASNGSKLQALHAAVASNNLALSQLLIENGANVNAVQIQNVTPLHSAVHRGNLEIVRLLVNNGAAINAKMDNGDTAKSIAQREKQVAILNFLQLFPT